MTALLKDTRQRNNQGNMENRSLQVRVAEQSKLLDEEPFLAAGDQATRVTHAPMKALQLLVKSSISCDSYV